MKRFYADVSRASGEGGYHVLLGGRPVRTPERAFLAVPGEALAEAICAEWAAQGEKIDPASMPITGFANATIDRVQPALSDFRTQMSGYGASDLLCYHATDPAPLVARQAELWSPLLDWARQRYDVTFTVTSGIMPVDQPPSTLARLHAAVGALDPWLLAGATTLVQISGTLVATLARLENALEAEGLWAVADLDDAWQAETWGEDEEASRTRARRRAELMAADRYCALVKAG
jgi:chaperone required for assembly of F1-ATPase